jgi:hypothetical protein
MKCSEAARCQPCSAVRRRTRICPLCGGFKARGKRAELCRTCFDAARRTAAIHNGVLRAFDAERFAKLLARPDVDWPPALLADRAGVHPDTIRGWLRGTKPRIVEWQRVAGVLALERCDHCGGSGTVDPSGPRRITAAVMRRIVQSPPLRIVRPDPKPLTGPVYLACGLRFEPNLLRLVGRGVMVPLTPAEVAILSAYARMAGRMINQAEVAALIGSTARAVNVHISRIYAKLRAAGIDPADVWEGSNKRGMRLLLADAPAVEGVG